MAFSISKELQKEIAEFYGSLSDRDLEMHEKSTKSFTKRLRRVAEKQTTGSLAGRHEDTGGVAPNEATSDDANP